MSPAIFSLPTARPQNPELSPSRSPGDVTVQAALDFTRRPQTPYWNTTPLTRGELATAMHRATRQDEAVLCIFRAAKGALSPSQVWEQGRALGMMWLLTSVRRSISNLTNAGVLVRLAGTRMGLFGSKEHLWALPVQQERAA